VHTLGTGERFEPGCEEAAEVNANHFALAASRQIIARQQRLTGVTPLGAHEQSLDSRLFAMNGRVRAFALCA
jgi:hypothetical protein